MNTSLTLRQALLHAHQLGLERIDAQMLLLHAIGQPGAGRAWLLTHDDDALTPAQQAQFAALCAQRLDGVPVAYLTGCKEFSVCRCKWMPACSIRAPTQRRWWNGCWM